MSVIQKTWSPMDVQLKWILTLYILYFGLTTAQPMDDQYRNLFDSIPKNNSMKNAEYYRQELEEKAAGENHAFNSSRRELSAVSSRNSAKTENHNEHMNLFKRHLPMEANQNTVTISSEVRQTDPISPNSTEEATSALPEENADWNSIRADNQLYIDKTQYITKLLKRSGKLWYITRPRRFGKSLFLQMMADFFRGTEKWFKGLSVEKDGNTKYVNNHMLVSTTKKWLQFPVIELNLGRINNFPSIKEYKDQFNDRLISIALINGVDPKMWSCFGLPSLIDGLKIKFNGLPVFILVDEFDRPFQYALVERKNVTLAKAVRAEINDMFTVIKNSIRDIRLAFFIGVSKLGLKVASQSEGWTAFVDLTHEEDFCEAFGFTKAEVKSDLGPNVRYWARNIEERPGNVSDNVLAEELMTNLTLWYDGYQFATVNESRRVLNPISTIKTMKQQRFSDHWTSTGGSLIDIVEQFYSENFTWDILKRGFTLHRGNLFLKLDPLEYKPPLQVLMLLTGYLTIASYDRKLDMVTLKIPNQEIENVLEYNIALYIPYKRKFVYDDQSELQNLNRALTIGDTKRAMNILKSFVFYPYDHPLKDQKPNEITRRLEWSLRAASIESEHGIIFQKDAIPSEIGGDIDLLTTSLPTNYYFENKCVQDKDNKAISAIKQSLGYMKEHPKNFVNAIKNLSHYNIVGMDFFNENGAISLRSWILLTCKNGTLDFPNMMADPDSLVNDFKTSKNLERYEKVTCGPVLP